MKNIVFIPNINTGNNRNTPYHYSIKSWKKWSEQYDDIEVIEWDEPIMDPKRMKITLQRYWVFDILKSNDIKYNQVLLVDADTIIHPNTPNFFNETQNKYCVVLNSSCYEWMLRSIREWGSALFKDSEIQVNTWEYFNTGFQIMNSSHEKFIEIVKEYYLKNIDLVMELCEKIKAGTCQTIMNYLIRIHKIEFSYLPECYNLQDLFRKNLLYIPNYSWWKDELLFLKAGWIYHFNAIPQNERHVPYWMERTYKELYEK